MEGQPHPYVPRDLQLPGYVPLTLSQSAILSIYGGASVLVVSLVWIFSGFSHKRAKLDRLLMCWWAFTGLTHMILEGYFAFSPEFYKDKTGFYLAEVWKEYSKGDSRYAFRDSGIVTVEGLTAVLEGPASLLAVYAIATGKSYSYILQFAISLGQLYGTAVYFITALLEGDNFATSPFHYYSYYILANSFWILIPTLISIRCWKKTCAAFQVQSQKKVKGKEYSKADSRYAARDAVGVTLEGLMVSLGGLCLIALYATGTGKSYCYLLQFAISLGHLYGSAVYVITSLLEGDDFAIIPYYYYAYYMLSNLCWKNTCAAFLQLQSQNKVKSH